MTLAKTIVGGERQGFKSFHIKRLRLSGACRSTSRGLPDRIALPIVAEEKRERFSMRPDIGGKDGNLG